MRLTTILCGIWTAMALCVGPAQAEKRVALVIGNSDYQNASKLANPVNDAKAMAEMFRQAGFEVVEAKTDLGNLEFKRVAREFTAIARDADIAVMFFAGHGIEVNGTNYLLPVDAKLASDFDVEDEALSLDRLARALEPAKRLRLIILDACRDNPFVRTMQRGVATRQVTSGLAKIEPATSDTLIAFAAKAGSTADDGRGANSPFTAALVKNLCGARPRYPDRARLCARRGGAGDRQQAGAVRLRFAGRRDGGAGARGQARDRRAAGGAIGTGTGWLRSAPGLRIRRTCRHQRGVGFLPFGSQVRVLRKPRALAAREGGA